MHGVCSERSGGNDTGGSKVVAYRCACMISIGDLHRHTALTALSTPTRFIPSRQSDAEAARRNREDAAVPIQALAAAISTQDSHILMISTDPVSEFLLAMRDETVDPVSVRLTEIAVVLAPARLTFGFLRPVRRRSGLEWKSDQC